MGESNKDVKLYTSINLFFQLISEIDIFILKLDNKEELTEELVERVSTVVSSSLFFIVRLIDAVEREATKLEQFEKISKDIAEYKQYVYRLHHNELFHSNKYMKNAVTVFEKCMSQVEG